MTLPAASKRVILIHPLVRELYKQALFVGLDYPLGIQKVRELWKEAIRNPIHCPSCYNTTAISTNSTTTTASSAPDMMNTKNNTPNPRSFSSSSSEQCEKEIRKAVGYGRRMIREMVGVIQFKKYRSMKQRYTRNNNNDTSGISGNNDKVEQYVSEENTSSSRSSSSSSSNNNNNHK